EDSQDVEVSGDSWGLGLLLDVLPPRTAELAQTQIHRGQAMPDWVPWAKVQLPETCQQAPLLDLAPGGCPSLPLLGKVPTCLKCHFIVVYVPTTIR
ncbi:Hypothetical predicted protein, partial [Scomber scombrus]